jgi:beta-lactamase superfamily II metal-dependent hydrolase
MTAAKRFGHRVSRAIVAALLAISASVLAATPVFAAPSVQPSQRVTKWVNVRSGPGTQSPIIAHLAPGQSVELIDVVPGWYVVRLVDGRTGYVSRGWTTRTAEAAAGAVSYRLHLIDVGTGLAVFVEGRGFAILYDGGCNDDTALGAHNRLLAYLRHARPDLTTLDHVILSHPHRDHVELLPDILAIYQIRNVWDSGRPNPICSYRAFLRTIRDKAILYHDADGLSGPHQVSLSAKTCYGRQEPAEQVQIPHAAHIQTGVPIALGNGASMTFLHADATEQESFNENSLVMALDLGRSRILFMGDAEAGGRHGPSSSPAASSVEGELLACCAAALRSDILVAGHHGSKTSSRTATLDAIGAYVFLVSAGPTRYATVTLPDHEVIEEFERRGTVYRTDRNDTACKTDAAKIGTDNDNQPGGCDNLVLTLDSLGHIAAAYDESAD